MKRMIDGIIYCLAESGGCELVNDGEIGANIKFCFPEGYWPISLNSKPFSILPGKINHGDESDISSSCFNEGGDPKWNGVAFLGDDINQDQGFSDISYHFKFFNESNRASFLKELFGKDITGEEEDIPPFAVPVSMLLVAFDASLIY